MLVGPLWRQYPLCILIAVLTLAACAPSNFDIKAKTPKESLPDFTVKGAVTVSTSQPSRNRVFVDESISVNYQQIAQTSVETLREALRHNSSSSQTDNGKSLDYSITSIDCLYQGACFINFVIRTGDGAVRGFMTEGKGLLLLGSLKEAAANTPAVVFSDKAILDYVAQ